MMAATGLKIFAFAFAILQRKWFSTQMKMLSTKLKCKIRLNARGHRIHLFMKPICRYMASKLFNHCTRFTHEAQFILNIMIYLKSKPVRYGITKKISAVSAVIHLSPLMLSKMRVYALTISLDSR